MFKYIVLECLCFSSYFQANKTVNEAQNIILRERERRVANKSVCASSVKSLQPYPSPSSLALARTMVDFLGRLVSGLRGRRTCVGRLAHTDRRRADDPSKASILESSTEPTAMQYMMTNSKAMGQAGSSDVSLERVDVTYITAAPSTTTIASSSKLLSGC